MTHKRHEYRLTLPLQHAALHTPYETGGELRILAEADGDLLAELMVSAYPNTIDYNGETLEDAVSEVASYFAGDSGQPLLDCSWLCIEHGIALSGCLVSLWQDKPLICYLMTRAECKGRGLARDVLQQALFSLGDRYGSQVRAVITEGNLPSERLFASFGFAVV